jgi:hypothetical protein
MPYTVKKVPNKNLYYVIDNRGNKLEQKPISKKKANQQMIAIHLSKLKTYGYSNVF